jgi:hypothetical protein
MIIELKIILRLASVTHPKKLLLTISGIAQTPLLIVKIYILPEFVGLS